MLPPPVPSLLLESRLEVDRAEEVAIEAWCGAVGESDLGLAVVALGAAFVVQKWPKNKLGVHGVDSLLADVTCILLAALTTVGASTARDRPSVAAAVLQYRWRDQHDRQRPGHRNPAFAD